MSVSPSSSSESSSPSPSSAASAFGENVEPEQLSHNLGRDGDPSGVVLPLREPVLVQQERVSVVAERVEEFLADRRVARRGEGEVPVAPRVQTATAARSSSSSSSYVTGPGTRGFRRGSAGTASSAKASNSSSVISLSSPRRRAISSSRPSARRTRSRNRPRRNARAVVVVVALDAHVFAAAAAVVEEIGDGDGTLTVSRVHLKRAGCDERRGGEERAVPRGAVLRLLSLGLGIGIGIGLRLVRRGFLSNPPAEDAFGLGRRCSGKKARRVASWFAPRGPRALSVVFASSFVC